MLRLDVQLAVAEHAASVSTVHRVIAVVHIQDSEWLENHTIGQETLAAAV